MTDRHNTYLDQYHRPHCTECGIDLDSCTCEDLSEKAEERLHSPKGQFLRLIAEELTQLEEGPTDTNYLTFFVGKEMGSLLDKIIDQQMPEGNGDVANAEIYRQCLKLASVVARFAIEGEKGLNYEAPKFPH